MDLRCQTEAALGVGPHQVGRLAHVRTCQACNLLSAIAAVELRDSCRHFGVDDCSACIAFGTSRDCRHPASRRGGKAREQSCLHGIRIVLLDLKTASILQKEDRVERAKGSG